MALSRNREARLAQQAEEEWQQGELCCRRLCVASSPRHVRATRQHPSAAQAMAAQDAAQPAPLGPQESPQPTLGDRLFAWGMAKLGKRAGFCAAGGAGGAGAAATHRPGDSASSPSCPCHAPGPKAEWRFVDRKMKLFQPLMDAKGPPLTVVEVGAPALLSGARAPCKLQSCHATAAPCM